jgi:hypothetical protein
MRNFMRHGERKIDAPPIFVGVQQRESFEV